MVYTEKHIRIISVTTAAAIHPVIGSSENDAVSYTHLSQLCQTGPFRNVDINDFKSLLKHMGTCGLLTQLTSGEIVVGAEGERCV